MCQIVSDGVRACERHTAKLKKGIKLMIVLAPYSSPLKLKTPPSSASFFWKDVFVSFPFNVPPFLAEGTRNGNADATMQSPMADACNSSLSLIAGREARGI